VFQLGKVTDVRGGKKQNEPASAFKITISRTGEGESEHGKRTSIEESPSCQILKRTGAIATAATVLPKKGTLPIQPQTEKNKEEELLRERDGFVASGEGELFADQIDCGIICTQGRGWVTALRC